MANISAAKKPLIWAGVEVLRHRLSDLLQQLIRNQCVNDGTGASGQEARNADLIAAYFEGSGLPMERYESAPGRGSLVARLEGSPLARVIGTDTHPNHRLVQGRARFQVVPVADVFAEVVKQLVQ